MNKTKEINTVLTLLLLAVAGILSGCQDHESSPGSERSAVKSTSTINPRPSPSPIENRSGKDSDPQIEDKWDLWTHGTQLRGANIWQRIVIPKLDGSEFLGNNYIGPPYTQDDFNRLADLGANYVNISGPGLYTETPPYQLDTRVQNHLDQQLEMIQNADMFAVITFRTGPGRSDFTFYRDGAGDWFDPSLLREWVWEDQEAQDAWIEMWRYTASRYADHPVVVGFDLMCEPHPGGIRDIWEPEEFIDRYQGTTLDWNQLYPRITQAIREVDQETPILIGGMGWSSLRWLPYIEPTEDPKTVYIFHQYEPQTQYTHQEYPLNSYPGRFDLDWDGVPDDFDQEWIESYLQVSFDFQEEWNVPLAVNEYGIVRWIPGGTQFLEDQLSIFEDYGFNHAIWMWDPAWEPWTEEVNAMNYRFGTNPRIDSEDLPNPLMNVLESYWSLNSVRPSSYTP
jgi:hypothetical protein